MDGLLFTSADLDQELIEKENRQKERERQLRIKEKKEKEEKEKKSQRKEYNKTLFLLDGYSIIYKSYWAFISRPLVDGEGNNISAYYGFFQTLFHILKENRMDALAVTMDEREPTFRHILYPEYKANREKAPDDLHKAVEPIKNTLSKMNIKVVSKPGFEADDVMASLSDRAEKAGWRTVIVSGDKDLCQLISPSVSILRPPKKKGESHYTVLDRDTVKEEYGVYPEQIVDYLSLLGDAADNVPGVSGIGEKSATRLLTEYVSLDGIYRHLSDLKEKEAKKLEDGRENAMLSKKLVVLSRDAVDDDFDIESLSTSAFTISRAQEDFEEKNLKSLVIRAKAKKDDVPLAEGEKPEEKVEKKVKPLLKEDERYLLDKGSYKTLKKADECEREFERIAGENGVVALFLLCEDYDAPSPVIGFAFSSSPLSAFYVPVIGGIGRDAFISLFEKYFSTGRIKVIAHSFKAIMKVLQPYDIKPALWGDTMIESWLLSSNDGIYSMDVLSGKYFSKTLLNIKDIASGPLEEIDLDIIALYSSLRADYTYRLDKVLSTRLTERGLDCLYREMELPLIDILFNMEQKGIYLSLERIGELKRETDKRIDELRKAIYLLAGYEFNINSTMQLSKLLYDERNLERGKKTMRGYSTDTETLEGLKKSGDPIISYLLEYRQLTKLKSTYIDVLPTLRDKNGRVHTTFLQTGTATGRLSSRSPNLQNIPVRTDIGRKIRWAFVPQDGKVFISADYSQIELVVLSWMSGDENLRKAFISGEDVHRYTAALIYNKSVDEVTPAERRVSKTINFGIMYGMSAFRLSGELDIKRSEAEEFIKRYFERYSSVKEFVEKTVKDAEEKGAVKTYWGHEREILGIRSRNKTEKAAAERTAVNTVIQGTAAEIMKRAMLEIDGKIKSGVLKATLILQVHDELIFEVDEKDAEEAGKIIKETMESAASLPVPLKVSVESAHSWGDMH